MVPPSMTASVISCGHHIIETATANVRRHVVVSRYSIHLTFLAVCNDLPFAMEVAMDVCLFKR